MDFKTKLLEQIKGAGLNGFTERQLLVRLNVQSADDKKAVKAALAELAASGEFILSAGGKYRTPASVGAVKGTLLCKAKGFGFLVPEDGGEDIFIPRERLGGAMHKDVVYAAAIKNKAGGRREGEVAAILERGYKSVVGTVKKAMDGAFVIPDDRDYFTYVFVPQGALKNAAEGFKVVAKITSYAAGRYPLGEVTEVLGKSGAPVTEVLAITRAFGFADVFEKSVKKEAVVAASVPFGYAGREDLRGLLTVTIDGDDAKDLDDAVSLTRAGEDFKLSVHIADVAHYVKHKSLLDNEAFKRGTSVYFPGNVIPMLPEELSNGVCSLNERVDRPALTTEMLIDVNGKVKGHKIYESVINSDARMTYKNVTKILDGDAELIEKYKDIVPMLRDMLTLSKILNAKRSRRGSVFFESRESVIETDAKGNVLNVKPYEFGVANEIIEEFMLAANETVAEFVSHLGIPFVYRVHEKPSDEKMEIFQRFMDGLGMKVRMKAGIKPHEVQSFLDLAENSEYKTLVNKILLRSMQKAKYDTVNKGHFGLAAKYYCHFTSPIRRYPDLAAHRIIKMMLNGGLNDKNIKKMSAFCGEAAVNSCERERAAELAERQCDDYYKAFFMEDKVGNEYDGIISSVTGFGIFVELLNTVEGLVRNEWLPADDYTFDGDRYTITGKKHFFGLGGAVRVRVESADRTSGQVNFSLVE
ncbi:MAG: ribonuclease R [Clostridiales bacterium]|nr:ribonuclease R [Clostridiales bacterium]